MGDDEEEGNQCCEEGQTLDGRAAGSSHGGGGEGWPAAAEVEEDHPEASHHVNPTLCDIAAAAA